MVAPKITDKHEQIECDPILRIMKEAFWDRVSPLNATKILEGTSWRIDSIIKYEVMVKILDQIKENPNDQA